ncbi:MAG: Integrase core domain protein [Microgenomates group bacterium ADurb.Bin219]|nr:MAG: Integrase core domain protein [Microgenomates group bacterium ADurb.Bin219]
MKYHNVKLDSEAFFRLRVMDAYSRMKPQNVRSLCKTFGISKSWFYKWKKRYNPRNLTSLKSLSRKPNKLASTNWSVVVEVCEWKRNNPRKSQYYLYQEWIRAGRVPPCSPKTIYNWWKRRNLIITRHRRQRIKSRLLNRAKLPGELFQMDTKFLPGKKYQYTAIDVVSKWRYLRVYPKLNQENTIDFVNRLLAEAGKKRITVTLIQTDNGHEFQADFENYLKQLNIAIQHTWIHTPDQNGVVERSHRTDEEEFYQETEIDYTDLEDINTKLNLWLEKYNTKRLHFSLNYQTPEEYLNKNKVSTI